MLNTYKIIGPTRSLIQLISNGIRELEAMQCSIIVSSSIVCHLIGCLVYLHKILQQGIPAMEAFLLGNI